ncbi:glycerophosphocholine cholinephosphodiesterase ENPP6-like [Ruditapes philippinarum]|uniref:glycerophosphocholine cholinephosphodiesterase ENPP6-like n=1 Tax=Ruditapes philippinarum TaxID=129788 RepID=UPI00295AF1F9|nr:glycerophosphocholine cholinephosphodiesterase ENPP6-like [Ruditapes philippinarum]
MVRFLRLKLITFLISIILLNEIESSKLVFLLVDGFRWDYFKLPGLNLNGFTRLFEHGTRAEWTVPAFPTNSFPNYKTLETGLHVENHGFVGNYMYDEQSGLEFELLMNNADSLQPRWWNTAEPFFITAEKQNIRTGLYYVRGCQIAVDGITPTFCLPYHGYPSKEDIDWAIQDSLDKMKNEQLDIAYIYHQEVDHMGHEYGPNSEQVKHTVNEVDGHINDMLDIIEINKQKDVDVIVLSDHGMASIDQLHLINITEVLDMDNVKQITEGGTQAYIWPVHGKEKHVYDQLKSFHQNLHVYLREDLHNRWFFKNHSLIPPIFLTADKGWFIAHPKSSDRYFELSRSPWHGNHGFDNTDHDMRSIFVAYGPDFKKNHTVKAFPNINVYQVLCYVTGIKANPNNGTWSEVKDMIASSEPIEKHLEL